MVSNKGVDNNTLFASALIATIAWHLTFGLIGATVSKFVYAICIWLTIFLSLKYRRNTFYKQTTTAILIMAFTVSVALYISIFYPDNLHVGNKWLSLFGNPFCLLTLLAPFFVYLSNMNNILNYTKKYFILYLIIGFPFAFISPMGYSVLVWFVPLFFPYINNIYRLLCLFLMGCCIYTGIFTEETSRTNLLLSIFCIINYIMVDIFIEKRRFLKIYCMVIIFLPMTYSIITLVDPSFSIFNIIFNWLSGHSADTQLITDTRSLLYSELSEDLSLNNSWLFGKGVDGHYYSFYFDNKNAADSYYRIASEVTFLTLLLHGGIIYVIGYYYMLIHTVFKTLKYGQSRFVISCALMFSTWTFMTFISVFFGCSLLHLIFFSIVGCCSSKKWLSLNDNQINFLFRK